MTLASVPDDSRYGFLITAFRQKYGDGNIRLFRAPGRINLRGMHVDTHGGFLNLMTHQREVVVAEAPSASDDVTVENLDAIYPPVKFRISTAQHPAFGRPWIEFIGDPETKSDVLSRSGSWENYLRGCALRLQHAYPERPLRGVRALVTSDLPRGEALSSSAALCVAFLLALAQANEISVPDDQLIHLARDAEWYAGTRCGLSDQAAIVMGRAGTLLNTALRPGEPPRYATMPSNACVVVIKSYTSRSLSGKDRVAYTRNRFAYSMALNVARQELARLGIPAPIVESLQRLPDFAPDALAAHGGLPLVVDMLKSVPEEIACDELRQRYHVPDFDTNYAHYFEMVEPGQRPDSLRLRGPLAFGIAESERARVFATWMECGELGRAGELMYIGHDGDRTNGRHFSAYADRVDNDILNALLSDAGGITALPGAYRASSMALDALVDKARSLGAYGACLTGAGIAGNVLALIDTDMATSFCSSMQHYVASAEYALVAGLAAGVVPVDTADAAIVNRPVHGACEIPLERKDGI